MTLPLITARERDPELAAVDLRSITDAAQAEALCDRIAATGALEDAARRAHTRSWPRPSASSTRSRLGAGRADALRLVADSVVERYR